MRAGDVPYGTGSVLLEPRYETFGMEYMSARHGHGSKLRVPGICRVTHLHGIRITSCSNSNSVKQIEQSLY